MAKKKVADAPVAPDSAPAALLAFGASAGDPIVYLRSRSGSLTPCHARSEKARQIHVNGMAYEHVSEHDGAWVYGEM